MIIVLRVLFVVLMLGLWFWTQKLISVRGFSGTGIEDKLHQWSAKLNSELNADSVRAKKLLIYSSLGIDLLGIYMLAAAIFGSSITPFVGLVLLFALRQLMQYLTALPPPSGMIWEHPGRPSLLVTYGVSNDLFFSGHTALAVYGAAQLCHSGSVVLAIAGIAIALFEVVTVIILRAHWTMDVYAGLVTALLVDVVAQRIGPWVDGLLHF